jgi:hypothetical protein
MQHPGTYTATLYITSQKQLNQVQVVIRRYELHKADPLTVTQDVLQGAALALQVVAVTAQPYISQAQADQALAHHLHAQCEQGIQIAV